MTQLYMFRIRGLLYFFCIACSLCGASSFPFLSFPFLSFPFLSFPFLSFPFLFFKKFVCEEILFIAQFGLELTVLVPSLSSSELHPTYELYILKSGIIVLLGHVSLSLYTPICFSTVSGLFYLLKAFIY
jgi:hypothetical protein